jgi:hypothetical protein
MGRDAPEVDARVLAMVHHAPAVGDAVHTRFKLQVDMIPEPLWGMNLRSATDGLGKHRWKKVRNQAIEECGGKCAICGSTQKLHGHEVWRYEEKKAVGKATLECVDVICWTCHNITHWGNTVRLIVFGAISHEGHMVLRRHFRRVNKCTQLDFERHARRMLAIWKRRSRLRWTVDWGPFVQAVEEAKQARELRHARRAKSTAFEVSY